MDFQPKNEMHPNDKKNLIIFIVASLLIWYAFDHFVIAPRMEAHEAEAKMQAAQEVAAGGSSLAEIPTAKIVPREEALNENARITIDTPDLAGSIALIGSRIDDIVLKNYFTELHGDKRVVLMSPAGTESPHYAEIGWLAGTDGLKVPGRDTLWSIKGGDGKLTPASPVTLAWSNGAGLSFERQISIDANYLMTVRETVTNTGKDSVTLYPYSLLARRGVPKGHGKGIGYEGPIGYIGTELQEISYGDLEDEREQSFAGKNGWIGFGEKYWLSSLLPEQTSSHLFRFSSQPDPSGKADRSLYQVDIRGEARVIAPNATSEVTTNLFVGAKKVSLLDAYEEKLGVQHFDLAVDFGVLYFLTKPLYFLLTLFNGWVGNFGVAIILLTIAVRGAVYPLANTSYRSFAMLRKIAPRMTEIRVKYGSDKQRLQQELVKLYETEKVNPMAGCLPLLLQIPIFFAVYKVISISVEMRHAPFFGWIHDLSERDPLSIFNLFGLLPFDVPTFMQIGPWSIVMLAMMLVQKHLNPPPQDQIQRDIANFMPWVMTYVLASFPSGLVIYWAFGNLLSVIQQSYIMRSLGVPLYLFSPEAAKAHHEELDKRVKEAGEKAQEEKKKETEGADSESSSDTKKE
jgi:YidC/Oxa1 family membrane protein insertase